MDGPTFRIPESVTGDPSDVAVALEVAGALWQKGEGEEAIRWLRRAVASASDADDAVRAAGLAGTAADLEEEMKARHDAGTKAASGSPSVKEPGPLVADPRAAASETERDVADGVAGKAHSETNNTDSPIKAATAGLADTTVTDPAAPPTSDFVSGAVPTARGSSPSGATADAHESTFIPSLSASPAPSMSAPPPRSPSSRSAASTSSLPAPPPPRSISPAAPRSNFAKPPAFANAIAAPPVLPARLRVSVKSSVRDSSLLFVRALSEGELAPPGTLEAFLVLAEANAPGKRNANGGVE